jgi:signal transduction histidine kinase/ActR/RegA family two-component response regulator
MNIKGWSLYSRTLLLGLGPALVISVIISGYFINARLLDVKQELDNKGQLIAFQLASTADYFVLTGNQSIISPLARVLLDDEDVQFIEIEDIGGVLLYSQSDNGFVEHNEPEDKGILRWYQADIIQYDVLADEDDWFAKESKEKILGQVRVGLSESFVVNRQNEIILHAVLIVGVSLIICALIAWLSGAKLARPISRLSEAVDDMTQGDYSARIKKTATGEVGQLQSGINMLADALEKSEEVQQHYVESLIAAREISEAANKAKSEFLAVMTHELRTPMNGVLGMLQLMQSTELTDEQLEYVDIALSSGDHLLGLINDILDFSKIEQGKLELESRFIPLHKSLTRVVDGFKAIVATKGLDFKVDIENIENLTVKTDETRIHQILVNLLGNAVKFTNKGHVALSVENIEYINGKVKLEIIVSDTGKGISEENLEHIFDAFQQEDTSISREFGGTGLGLAISRQLVEKMNGKLIVQSAFSQGSRFICQFTWDASSTNSLIPEQETIQLPNETYVGNVLLVEDNDVNQKIALKMIKEFGVDCDLARDGMQALSMCAGKKYDLILMDLQMPVLDGFEATKAIRTDGGINCETSIIAMTANALYDVQTQCESVGMNGFLAKPYKKALLKDVLRKWLTKTSSN